jgi:hypothetical protein
MTEQIPAPKTLDLSTIIMNVFSSPVDAFNGMRESESRPSLWLLPLVVTVLFVAIMTYVLATNEVFHQQIVDAQVQTMNEMVAQGKMTQEQATQASDRLQSTGTGMFMAFGIVFGSIFVALYYFLGSLFLWLGGKAVLKTTAGYGKHLEVYGTANWIGILGAIVTLMIMYAMNSMYASPSAALAVVSHYDVTDKMHKLLSTLNIFTLWQTVVIGIGLSKLADKKLQTGITVAIVLWAVWIPISIYLNIAR